MYHRVKGALFSEFCATIVQLRKDGVELASVTLETLALMRKRHGKGIEQEARQG